MVDIEIAHGEQIICDQKWGLNQEVGADQQEFEFCFSDHDLPVGEIEVKPRLSYSVSGRSRTMIVDNYHNTRKSPLHVTIARDPLPKIPGWQTGDTHLHTSLTSDQIEFGASLERTRKAAQLTGLDFISSTDHSYDLDDEPDNYLKNDPELQKWKQSRQLIAKLNEETSPAIIPGEEISVSNARGSIVHFLHFNDKNYYPGDGDSGENWPDLSSELTIDDVLSKRSDDTISVAAHSGYKFPWLQRVLLNRGYWESADHDNPELNGIQILCGTPAYPAFHASRQLWIEALLRGKKLAAYGGSDGHGNFNRNWHVSLPMWSLGTHGDQLFAQSRTLVKSKSAAIQDLIEGMKLRRTAISTGPVGDLILSRDGKSFGIGDIVHLKKGDAVQLTARGSSTAEFGSAMDVTVYSGIFGAGEETILSHSPEGPNSFELELNLEVSGNSYVRLEISSEGSRWPGIFASSPIWIELQPQTS